MARGEIRPFCAGDREREKAYEGWMARLERAGFEATEADAFVIGLVASREVKLERLRKLLQKAKQPVDVLRIGEAERRAAGDLRATLEFLERAVGERLDEGAVEAGEEKLAVVGGGRKVLAMPARKHTASMAAGDRIKAALARAKRPLTKPEIRKRVPGDAQAFLGALKKLHATGEITRKGRGVNRSPFRYGLAGGAA